MSQHPESVRLAHNIRQTRTTRGLTQRTAAQATTVSVGTWQSWEAGTAAPKPWRLAAIAAALGVPLAALFAPEGFVAVTDVQLTPEAVARVRALGEPEAKRIAEQVASQLPALILATCRTPPRPSTGGRGKPRRTRAEVLAGIQEANTMRAARAAREPRLEAGPPEGGSRQVSGGLPGALTAEQ